VTRQKFFRSYISNAWENIAEVLSLEYISLTISLPFTFPKLLWSRIGVHPAELPKIGVDHCFFSLRQIGH